MLLQSNKFTLLIYINLLLKIYKIKRQIVDLNLLHICDKKNKYVEIRSLIVRNLLSKKQHPTPTPSHPIQFTSFSILVRST